MYVCMSASSVLALAYMCGCVSCMAYLSLFMYHNACKHKVPCNYNAVHTALTELPIGDLTSQPTV